MRGAIIALLAALAYLHPFDIQPRQVPVWWPMSRAWAQEHPGHAQFHPDYKNWSSTKTQNCCNEQDCHPLEPGQWRETATGTEVKIDNEWCPVRSEHLLIKGKSPDWTRPHACIIPSYSSAPPCSRLLCFAGEPKG